MKKIICFVILIITSFGCEKDSMNEPQIDQTTQYSIPDSLNFSILDNNLKITIKNEGKIAIHYNVENSNKHIKISSSAGEIAVGNQNDMIVSINRDDLSKGKFYSKLYFNFNNKKDSIVIGVDNFIEQKVILNSDVIDAEYSKVKDQLVFVSEHPMQVNILKSGSETIQTIPLLYTPTCISISQDGETAVVGHDGHITYVNLNTKSIIKTYNVSCFAIDIVLGNNKWAYVFPKENQSTYIRCINMNLSTENENHDNVNQIYAGTKGKMDLSGKFIYGAANGVSPADIDKFDIQNGTAVKIYDSPYHGDYPFNGDFWFSEDGNRIFTRGRTVLRISETKSQDLIYNGTINATVPEGHGNIEWLDHSSKKNNLYLILSSGYYWPPTRISGIFIYDSTNLNFKSKLELEKFFVPNNENGVFYDAEPYFVFSNAEATSLFVITKAKGAGLAKEWAIQKIAI
ncbi:hypothetical protein OA88_00420 [Flavobacterium sp. JRM]|nr:hypothetical protein OA88_00420 [Flavobacterium sp. JRM]